MFIHQNLTHSTFILCKIALFIVMEPKTLEQEAIVRLLSSSRSQSEWDTRVKTLLTCHFQGKMPDFWVNLVIKSPLYPKTRAKWIQKRLFSKKY